MTSHDDMTGASGRLEPRPAPVPEGFRHDVRIWVSPGDPRISLPSQLIARCRPCEWSVALEPGHTVTDLVELERQHSGEMATADLLKVAYPEFAVTRDAHGTWVAVLTTAADAEPEFRLTGRSIATLAEALREFIAGGGAR